MSRECRLCKSLSLERQIKGFKGQIIIFPVAETVLLLNLQYMLYMATQNAAEIF